MKRQMALVLLAALLVSMACIGSASAEESFNIIEDTTCCFQQTKLPNGSYLTQYDCVVEVNRTLLDKNDTIMVEFTEEDSRTAEIPKKGCFVNDLYYLSYQTITNNSLENAVNRDTIVSVYDKDGTELQKIVDKELFNGFAMPSVSTVTHDVWVSNEGFLGFNTEYQSRLEITLTNEDPDSVVFVEGDLIAEGAVNDYMELERFKLEPGESIMFKTRAVPYFPPEEPERTTIRLKSDFKTLSLEYWQSL